VSGAERRYRTSPGRCIAAQHSSDERSEALLLLRSGDQLQFRSGAEDAVVWGKRDTEPGGGSRYPTVAIVDLAAESVTDVVAAMPKLGTYRDHLVVGLDDGEFGDMAL
jgi:hypothetical protein